MTVEEGSPRSSHGPARRCVVEHQGPAAVRIVHQSNGNILCEPMAPEAAAKSEYEAPPPVDFWARFRRDAHICACTVAGGTAMLGACAGLMVGVDEYYSASWHNRPVSPGKVAKTAQALARTFVTGVLTGAVVAPVTAVVGVARLAVRPALAGLAVHGVVRWIARHHIGAAAILKKLQSGDLSRQLEALRQLIARLDASAPFCNQFKRLAGVEVLLKMLEDLLVAVERGASLLGGSQAALTVRAIAQLAKQGDAVDTMVEMGGVPLLLRALSYGQGMHGTTGADVMMHESSLGSAQLVVHATAALARIAANNAVAQHLLASEPSTAGLVVALLRDSTARGLKGVTVAACDELRSNAVALVQALALEPTGKAALGNAGGVEALSTALVLSNPWTLGQATAAAALHALVRGDMDNQRRLAAVAPTGLSAAIHRALASAPGTPMAPLLTPVIGAGTTPSCNSPLAGVVKQQGDQLQMPVMLMGDAGRWLSPQDCHAHRADLLALSNVIQRLTGPPAALVTRSNSTSSSGSGITTPPLPGTAAAPAPTKVSTSTAFLNRLRLRGTKPAPPASVAPVVAALAAATEGAVAADVATGAPAEGVAGGPKVVDVMGVVTGGNDEVEELESEEWDVSATAHGSP